MEFMDRFFAWRLVHKAAKAFGQARIDGTEVIEVHVNPIDLYRLFTVPAFSQMCDRETQRSLIRLGVVGYLWGSTVKVKSYIKSGKIVFVTERDLVRDLGAGTVS